MKHDWYITLFLISLFFIAQLIGISVINNYIDKPTTQATGNLTWQPLPSAGSIQVERPDINANTSYIYFITAIFIGTLLILLIIKFNTLRLWKLWFFLAATLTLAIAFGAFLPATLAYILGILFALIKVFKPNFIVHNFTELFMYAGIAAIFIPKITIFSAIILLILISLYDMYAVWKSKHMITMAKFQTRTGLFPGMLIPYNFAQNITQPLVIQHKKSIPTPKNRTALLGGGDIAFPMLFTGAVLVQYNFISALLITIGATTGLTLLLIYGNKNKFYPAMPFITLGTFVAYGVVLLL